MLKALDTLIAHKMINLSDALSGNDKRVAAALIDHFNRKTGQCDPSLSTIAELLGVHPRTVMRSIGRLERAGFFRKVKHGGKFHRNSYEPMWLVYRQFDDAWKDRRKARRATFASPNVSLCQGQPRHPSDRRDVTQTCLKNHFKETWRTVSPKTQPRSHGSKSGSGSPGFGGWKLAEASLERLCRRIGQPACDSWFRDVQVLGVRGATLVLSAPTKFHSDHVASQFMPQLLECFRPDHPNVSRIELIVRPKDVAGKISHVAPGGGRGVEKSETTGGGPDG